MKEEYRIETKTFKHGNIVQSLYHENKGGKTKLNQWVMDTQEEGIRQALIKLGWKEPEVD